MREDELPDIRPLRPGSFVAHTPLWSGPDLLAFKAREPDDLDWIEEMILTHGYYEHEGVWDLALGFDKQAMAEIIAAFRPARTLEIGCASGTVLHYLASLGLPCEGIGDQAAKATDDAACTKFVEEAMVALNREPFAVYLYSLDDLYGVQRWVQGFLPRLDQTIRVTSMGVTPK